MKIPLKSLSEWKSDTQSDPLNLQGRFGVTARNEKFTVGVYAYGQGVAWFVSVQGGFYHREHASYLGAAMESADAYLAEHFELPVSLEDKLKAAEKRIEELEKQSLSSAFKPGQKVRVKRDVGEGIWKIAAVRVFEDYSVIYELSDGAEYLAHNLEAVPS